MKLDRTWRSRLKRAMVSLRNSPEAIARGAALGVFTAFLPIFGFQMILAALLATFLKANRPAALLATWVSNPFTMPPIFLFTYRLGVALTGGAAPERYAFRLASALRALTTPASGIGEVLHRVAWLGGHAMACLFAGGLLVGLVAAAVSYPVILWLGRRFGKFRERAHPIRARIRQ